MKVKELYEYRPFRHSGRDVPYDSHRTPPATHRRDPDMGPHEGKELTMLLDKKKPAAIVPSVQWYNEYFKKHVDDGTLIAKKFKGRPFGFPDEEPRDEYVVAQPGEEQRVDRIIKLLTPSWDEIDKTMGIDAYNAKLGLLLGYTKEQIRKFIER